MALGSGGTRQPAYPQPPAGGNLGGTIGSFLGGVLGGGSHNQQPAYQPSGGYGSHGSTGSDFLSGIGSALFSSALDGLNRNGKDVNKLFSIFCSIFSDRYNIFYDLRISIMKITMYSRCKSLLQRSHNEHRSGPYPQSYEAPPQTPPKPAPCPQTPPSSGGHKLTAEEISKGLGLED